MRGGAQREHRLQPALELQRGEGEARPGRETTRSVFRDGWMVKGREDMGSRFTGTSLVCELKPDSKGSCV